MISQKLQDLLKKLSKSIWADDKGNVEIGKNLEVDGEATINTKLTSTDNVFNSVTIPTINSIRTPNGSGGYDALGKTLDATYSKAKYHHLIMIGGTSDGDSSTSLFISADLSTNTPIDSIQDLTTYLGGGFFLCTGEAKLSNWNEYQDLRAIKVGNSVADTVIYVTYDDSPTFSQCFTSIETFADDVSIPR